MLFGDREHEVKESLREYLRELEHSLDLLDTLLEGYLEDDHPGTAALQKLTEQNREAESVRRRVQARVYEEGFLPVLREDYVRFTRDLAGVTRAAGATGELIVYQQPPLPRSLHAELRGLVESSRACFGSVTGTIEPLGEDEGAVNEALEELIHQHREFGERKSRLIRDLFRDEEMSLAEKLLVRDLLQGLASSADSLYRAAEHIQLLQVKRRL